MNRHDEKRHRPVALVTGAARGIGRAAALALAERGFDVALVDLAESADIESTCERARALGARAKFVAADITALDGHAAIVDAACAQSGTIDVLVNNAGISVAKRGDVLEVTPESFDRVLGVNLRGTFFLTQAVARRMVDAPAAGDYLRSIVTVSSANAFIVSPDRAEYCLSKTALSMMVKVFAVRLAEAGIACYEVRPGIIRTEMTRVATEKYDRLIAGGLTPIARWGEPDDVGRAIASLAAGELPFTTGEAIHIDGGLHIRKL